MAELRGSVRTVLAIAIVAAAFVGVAALASPGAGTAVVVPFDPPLAVPIRYDYERRSDVGGQQRQRLRATEELTFRRGEAGDYRLHWVTRAIAVEAPGPMQPAMQKVYGLGVDVPIIIRVSPEGAALAVENAAEMRSLSNRMLEKTLASLDEQFAGLPPDGRALVGRMLAAVVDQQRGMSDAAFAEALLESPLLMFPGLAALVPGVPSSSEVEAESPLGGRMRFRAQVELRRYEPGVAAEVRVSSIANPEDARRATTSLMARLFAAIADPVARAKAEADFAAMGPMAISDEAVIVLSLPSGIPETMQYSKRIAIPGQPVRTDSRRYTRQK